ncbi:repressor LexA [Fusobacterium sp. PH5-7]|uniref:helix-turn-helix domain-containing protein n=1 Tax=Fusobacterium sp. PH5-7 TaxID=2940528 RepID=UPI00247456A5|nr:XRE family transcriptional regulator [Fusobacterium sp. PH5-7]MDH6457601.1 repressor LexA [Fusobacterium sp. PH5-7]
MSNITELIAKNITKLRTEKKFTQKKLAEKIGLSKGAITNYEVGTRSPSFETLQEIADALEVDIQSFFKENIEVSDFFNKSSVNKKIPIISHASAGRGIFGIEEILDYIELPEKITTKCDFATYVKGNSMEPKIFHGDIICIKRDVILENGDIGLFFLNDNIYVKKFNFNPFTNEFSLISLNKNYDPIIITMNDEFHELGKVICKFDYNF